MTADKPDTLLEEIRREIDAIDNGLLQMLVRRFDASARVRATKKTDGSIASSALRPAREALMLRRLIASGGDNVPADVVVRLWRVILSASAQAQAPITIHVETRVAENAALSVRIAEHFSGITRELQPDVQTSLGALSENTGDLAVVDMNSPWATWLASQPSHNTVSIVATLPVIANGRTPELLVFGHAEPQPSGFDETILIGRESPVAFPRSLRWHSQSGDWRVTGYSGFITSGELHDLGGDVLLAGRCPTSIEVI